MSLTFQDFLDDLIEGLVRSWELQLTEFYGRAEMLNDWLQEHFGPRKAKETLASPDAGLLQIVESEVRFLEGIVAFHRLKREARKCFEENFWHRLFSCIERVTSLGIVPVSIEAFIGDLFAEVLSECIAAHG